MDTFASLFSGENELEVVNANGNFSEYLLSVVSVFFSFSVFLINNMWSLSQKAKADLPSFNLHNMVGMSIESDVGSSSLPVVVSHFNNQPYHVPPLALSLVDQALLRQSTGISNLRLITSNHPLPRTDTEKVRRFCCVNYEIFYRLPILCTLS